MRKRLLIAAALVLACWHSAYSQYYITGQTPARQKWGTIKTDSLQMIFPLEFESQARRTLYYMEQARRDVGHGFPSGPMKTPVVFKTENFLSNGVAMQAPRRIELIGIPSTDTYANPWLKQLAVHEYRHMVQYNNVNCSTVKFLSYFFGQQATILAMGLLDFWYIEGDAVIAETQSSPFGRGYQPSFTIHYRALGDEITRKKKNIDKWFCGSYRDHVPSHYELGYQLVSYTEREFGEYIWDDMLRFTGMYPVPFYPITRSLKKFYNTSTNKIFHETFGELNGLWDSLPQTEDNASRVSPSPTAYTTYSHPLYVNDTTIVALREDYNRTSRFVSIDPRTGEETRLWHTGYLSSRPVYADGTIWWSEYRQSMLWEQKVDSRIYSRRLDGGRTENYRHSTQGLYPTPTDNGLAYIKYHYDGHFSIEWNDWAHHFPTDVSLHGLAFDNHTQRLYYIILGDEGMWIEGICTNGPATDRQRITEPSFVTVSNLTAGGGKLYFGSIQSGKDEAHMYDLAAGREYRLSDSQFGAFSPSPSNDGQDIALTVYNRMGPAVATLPACPVAEVAHARIPENIVNIPLADWEFQKTDTIIYTTEEASASEAKYASRRYRKGLNLFNLHSWAPLDYNPETVFDDLLTLNVRAGATLISQNTLGSAVSSLNYGYLGRGESLVRGRFTYYGWAPKISVSGWWSDQGHRVFDRNNHRFSRHGSYMGLNARVYLPMVLSNGYMTTVLTPSASYAHTNDRHYNSAKDRFETENIFSGSLQFYSNVRMARLDLIPRWGIAARTTWSGNPFSSLYTDAGSAYVRVYLPGIVRPHGLSIAAAAQKTFGDTGFLFAARELVPRGFTDIYPLEYTATSINYHFPIAYPEWGIPGFLYFKRIALTPGVDYARYTKLRAEATPSGTIMRKAKYSLLSYGATLRLDITPLRMPSASTSTLTVSFFRKNDDSSPWYFNIGLSVPL